MILAVIADVLQIVVFPLLIGGVESPADERQIAVAKEGIREERPVPEDPRSA
jgi:hypothetical protein